MAICTHAPLSALGQRQAAWNRRERREDGTFGWLLYLAVLFLVLTGCSVLLSDNVRCSAIGAWYLVGNFVAIAFLVLHVKRFEQFVRVHQSFLHGGATGILNLVKAAKVL